MHTLRTPDDRFADLPDYPFAPHYVDVDGLRYGQPHAGIEEGIGVGRFLGILQRVAVMAEA